MKNICNSNGVPRIIHMYASTINFKGLNFKFFNMHKINPNGMEKIKHMENNFKVCKRPFNKSDVISIFL